MIPDNIYPARGRKLHLECFLFLLEYIPDNIYPARGRKLKIGAFGTHIIHNIPDNIYPARGRKPYDSESRSVADASFPTIFTPQGDGNAISKQFFENA